MFVFLLFLLSFNLYSIEITEENLLELAGKDVPALDEIQSRLLQSRAEYQQAKDKITGSEVYGGYNHVTTNERALNPFIPVFSPVNQFQAGVKKPTQYGVSADFQVSLDERSSTSSPQQTYDDINTTVYALTLNVDLWKNLFGKLSRKQLENAKLSSESAALQSDIEKKSFLVTVRRLYWSLVANNEKILISQKLLEASQAQAADAEKRRQARIADPGEVARYKAQVAQRRGTLLYLDYEREQMLKQLKDLVPKLQGEELNLAKYDLNKTLDNVLACAAVIQAQPEVPMGFTKYDEVVSLLKRVQSNQAQIDQTYDDIDVSLAATVKETGLGSDEVDGGYAGSFEKSWEDLRENDRSGVEAGIFVTIPLGKKASGTEEVLKAYNKKRLEANIRNTHSNLITTHRRIANSVVILGKVIQNQKINNQQLGIRVNEMRKQYRQARIGVSALIQDEDSLASSSLALVDTQLSVLNTLFDYFSVFTETPCDFNRI